MYKFFVLAASAALASAYTTPTTQCTDGCNPIAKPGLNEVVPAGAAYEITWQPTTDGTVSLVLLKGPSENIIPVYAVAEKIPNTGSFSWTPASELEPTGNSGYGFQIINDADGTYQWSTQFGISNDAYTPSASSSASTPSGSMIAGGAVHGGNHTISSAAVTSAAPTGFSNSTAIITSPSSEATDASTTFSRITSAGGSSTPSASSSPVSSENSAVALGAFSMTAAFAAVVAAVFAL